VDLLQDDLANRIGKNRLGDPVPAIDRGVDQPKRGNAVFDHLDRVMRVALLFRKIVLRGDDESEIPDAGAIKPGRIDFVENAVADREPDPAFGSQSRAHRALGTGGPAWANAGDPGGTVKSVNRPYPLLNPAPRQIYEAGLWRSNHNSLGQYYSRRPAELDCDVYHITTKRLLLLSTKRTGVKP